MSFVLRDFSLNASRQNVIILLYLQTIDLNHLTGVVQYFGPPNSRIVAPELPNPSIKDNNSLPYYSTGNAGNYRVYVYLQNASPKAVNESVS
ncbi:hypothetical protein At1D1108_11950 [Agrobacterium tumefaciens]|nr:hypothetical protein At1D1108_11950 [Agrobacterium tumefaciens]